MRDGYGGGVMYMPCGWAKKPLLTIWENFKESQFYPVGYEEELLMKG
jgi:hypothetical protein